MKFTSLLLLLVLLASCWTETAVIDNTWEVPAAIEKTTSEIDAELEVIEYTEEEQEAYEAVQEETDVIVLSDEEFEVVTVQAIYNNPKQEVFIDINYVLDNDDKISEIQVTNTNYDGLDEKLGDLNVLVWKTLNEVEETYVSGGSLTVPAVKKALSAGA